MSANLGASTSDGADLDLNVLKQPTQTADRLRQKQSDDGPPTKIAKMAQPTFSDVSRLRQHLNDDCLFNVFGYLSFYDIMALCESSTQMAEFAGDNFLPEYARDRRLLATGGLATVGYSIVPTAKCIRLLHFLGPHLTHLTINGNLIESGNWVMRAVLENCPHLASLHLFNVSMHIPADMRNCAADYGQLKELCLTECTADSSVTRFINELDGLESLALHDTKFRIYDEYLVRLECKHLRKLSVFDPAPERKWYVPTLMASRGTLRELYLDIRNYTDNGNALRFVPTKLPDLEGLLFKPHGIKSNIHGLANMRKLRKIMLSNCDESIDLTWLERLAGGPNLVEHLVLIDTVRTKPLLKSIVLFGAQLRTLALHHHQKSNAVPMLKRLPALRELVLMDMTDVEPIMVAAIETAVHLWRITLRTNVLKIKDIVDACRSAAIRAEAREVANKVASEEEAPQRTNCAKKLELEIHKCATLVNEELLLKNQDIINYIRKDTHIEDSIPIDEYIYNRDAPESEDDDSNACPIYHYSYSLDFPGYVSD